MESKSRATTVGIFVLAMVVMLVGTVLWFSQDRTDRITYDIITEHSAGGIVREAAVELYGLNVGRVESVSFVEDQPGHVRIRLMVDKNAPINRSTYATIASRGVTGAAFIALVDDDKQPLDVRASSLKSVTPAGNIPVIPLRLGVLDSFTAGMAQFADRAGEVLESLDRLMSQENEQKIFAAVENIGNAADEISKLSSTFNNEMMGEFKSAAHQVSVTLKDVDTLVVNANGLISDLKKSGGMMENLTEGASALTGAANRLRYVTLPQVEAVTENATATLRATKRLTEKLEDQPDMLIFGSGVTMPGPGEPGYKSPYTGR